MSWKWAGEKKKLIQRFLIPIFFFSFYWFNTLKNIINNKTHPSLNSTHLNSTQNSPIRSMDFFFFILGLLSPSLPPSRLSILSYPPQHNKTTSSALRPVISFLPSLPLLSQPYLFSPVRDLPTTPDPTHQQQQQQQQTLIVIEKWLCSRYNYQANFSKSRFLSFFFFFGICFWHLFLITLLGNHVLRCLPNC